MRDKRNELIKVNQPQAICQPSATYLNNDRNLRNIIDKTSLIMLHSSKDDQFEQDFGDNSRSQSIRFTNDLPTLNSHVGCFPIQDWNSLSLILIFFKKGMYFRPPPPPPNRQENVDVNSINFLSRNALLNQSPNLFTFEAASENSFKIYQAESKSYGN